MKALEVSAGTPLVVRAGREMRLTEAGEALTRHAAGILAGLTAAEEEVAAIAGLRAGRVRLVSFPSGSSAIVPAAAARMRADHPGTNVSLEEAEPSRSVAMLRSGECEVVLAFRYLGGPHTARSGSDSRAGSDSGSRSDPGARRGRGFVHDEGGGSEAAGGHGPELAAGSGSDVSGRRGSDPGVGSGARPVFGTGRGFGYVGGHGSGSGSGAGSGGEWDDLVVRPLLTDRLVGLVPVGHRLAGAAPWPGAEPGQVTGVAGSAAASGTATGGGPQQPVRMADLAEEPWIAGCPSCRRHLVDVCEAEGFTPRVDFATDDYPAVAGLVGAGLGVAMLPELALRSMRPEGVAFVDVSPAVRREVVALTLPDLAHVPVVEEMLARLVEAAARR